MLAGLYFVFLSTNHGDDDMTYYVILGFRLYQKSQHTGVKLSGRVDVLLQHSTIAASVSKKRDTVPTQHVIAGLDQDTEYRRRHVVFMLLLGAKSIIY